MPAARRLLIGLGLGTAGLAAGVAAAAGLTVLTVARRFVTPPSRRARDVRILEVAGDRITLEATPETVVPGRYGLWFSNDRGYARLGRVVDERPGRVTREVESVVFGELNSARAGRWSGWLHLHPRELGLAHEEIEVLTPVGAAPAWLLPAPSGVGTRWAVLVHGRAVTRAETLRAVSAMHDDDRTVLVVSYRNDGDAPPSDDGRYALGVREWQDVDAALREAKSRGADDVVLMGWSMGGATVLQTAVRSVHADVVRGLVLESPAVDWATIVHHQVVVLRRLPQRMSAAVIAVLGSAWLSRLTGLAAPIDLAELDFVHRADELRVPVLVLHSDDDDFVPSTASRALAVRRPDLVTLEAFDTAKHTRLWNYDPERWTGAISAWLAALPPRRGR